MANLLINVKFLEQIDDTRKRVKECFKRTRELLINREEILLTRIDQIETEYKTKTDEMLNVLEALSKAKTQNTETLIPNTLDEIRREVQASIDRKIAELTVETDCSIEFIWDNLFETDIEQLGSIQLNDETSISPTRTFPPQVKVIVPEYKTKQLPTTYSCKKSSDQKAPGELNGGRSLTVHYKTGNIYITDRDNHRVQVFNSNGDYIFMFSAKMNEPRGICISKNYVYVTQINVHSVNMYELGGKLIASVGSQGNKETQFNRPHCIDFSHRTDNIYVCDSDNGRIQILTEDLRFHSVLGIGVLNKPLDIKVTRDRVLVLDDSDPCMLVFTSEHVLINRLITRGNGKQTNKPRAFDIDREYNFIMSDYKSHCVHVFNKEGELVHRFGKNGQGIGEFDHPCGIALDNKGQIIVVCQKNDACLQFF
ncbi:PEP-CTERM domain protein [Oopsacas minuta]|uniref:PEP-CTERM domain protein n=1 Tax=Oopsacas minuta TaxID=111878 RepID=A0AAV7JUC3_9METZ|nr:PEP-CTERM domain protein [Oopsacas minuta]